MTRERLQYNLCCFFLDVQRGCLIVKPLRHNSSEVVYMHSKQTVKYICKEYLSGHRYFFKQEIIAVQSWEQPDTLIWGAQRPITEKTFRRRQKEGYKCYTYQMKSSPAKVIPFPIQYLG